MQPKRQNKQEARTTKRAPRVTNATNSDPRIEEGFHYGHVTAAARSGPAGNSSHLSVSLRISQADAVATPSAGSDGIFIEINREQWAGEHTQVARSELSVRNETELDMLIMALTHARSIAKTAGYSAVSGRRK
jgi:hypothetical protein